MLDKKTTIDIRDLIINSKARLPIVLLLDTSGSMTGRPIEKLEEAVQYFFEAIKEDEIAKRSAEISIISFNSIAEELLGFANIERQSIPKLITGGTTSMGKAINIALDVLEKRKKEYSEAGVEYYQPWLVLISDGEATDEVEEAIKRAQSLTVNKKLTIFSVAIGKNKKFSTLRRLSSIKSKGKKIILSVSSLADFKDFFKFLSQSVAIRTKSALSDEISLNIPERFVEITL